MSDQELCIRRAAIEADLAVTADTAVVVEHFHRWIGDGYMSRQPVDVATYDHVVGGPGVLLIGAGYLVSWRCEEVGGTLRYDRHAPRPLPLGTLVAELLSGFLLVAGRFAADFNAGAVVDRLRLRIVDRAALDACIPEENLDAIAAAWDTALPGKQATFVRLSREPRESCGVQIHLRVPLGLTAATESTS